ncbi:glycerate kinase [Microbacterium sediminis]|uniref:Glycerate kinase n=1 Tax=Microbacterium sediminis TaxID=904291 RepID=A0A1B9ND82_9MICO|nr:glycerate kinase [Microbacterium sediminis]OCG74557.1 glycerate kinase [Microbacterium sediminis]QBR74856.1 glycerate kinase [Microbacterium sediminis]
MTSRRIVFAPDSFKGSCAAADVARALAAGSGAVDPVLRPMADGGEGTLGAIAAAVPGARHTPVRVTGPRGLPVDAAWLWLPPTDDAPQGTGVVELASTSGIELLGDERRPWDASTLGFGQAIAAALAHGVSRLVLAIGSSASTDGGTGLLTALGARFTDAFEVSIAPGAAGLEELAIADLSRLRGLPEGGVQVLTDVTSPLLGSAGAAAVFGPQKGIDDVARADAALGRLVDALRRLPGATLAETAARHADPEAPGAGAAGGAGYGLLAWGAELVPGAARIAELTGLREAIAGADLVVTGEGAFDGQSAVGKAPGVVAALAAEAGVPVALVAGRIAPGADMSAFARVVSLTDLAGSAEAALTEPERWIEAAGAML